MEKFLMIMRENGSLVKEHASSDRLTDLPAMHEWIQSLRDSGNYSVGAVLANTSRYVGKYKVVGDYSYGETNEGILGYDVILAEDFDQAVSIAQTCPMVINGIAVIEIRLVVPLIR